MSDALLQIAATEFVESFGQTAAPMLYERAQLSEDRGHRVAARTWRALAGVAARILAESEE